MNEAMLAGPGSRYPPLGTSEDLLAILARAETLRYDRLGVVVPPKTDVRMAILEPAGNLVGLLFRGFAELMPASWMLSVEDKLYKSLAGASIYPFDESSPGLLAASRLAAEMEKSAGRPPALLAVLSHPPVTGEWLHLNVEMIRHALRALSLLRGRPSRPKLVAAVDPFALDMLSAFEEGAYAGFMGTYHLGFDRLAGARGRLSRCLVGASSWRNLPGRLARILLAGGEVAIMPSGGVPATARALYAAREFLQRMAAARPPGRPPREALRALSAADEDFAAFSRSGLVGPRLKASAWRMAEAWTIAVLTGAWGHDPARDGEPSVDGGRLTPAGRRAFVSWLRALGWPDAEAQRHVRGFEAEFARETPCRERFFRFLAGRVVAKGRPVVLLPLTHGRAPDIRLSWGEPAGLLSRREDGLVKVRRGDEERDVELDRFARDFIGGGYL